MSPKTTKYDESTLHMKILQNSCKKGLFAYVLRCVNPLLLYAWRTLLLDPLPPSCVRTKWMLPTIDAKFSGSLLQYKKFIAWSKWFTLMEVCHFEQVFNKIVTSNKEGRNIAGMIVEPIQGEGGKRILVFSVSYVCACRVYTEPGKPGK